MLVEQRPVEFLRPQDFLYKFFRDVGNSIDMKVDGSGTPVPFLVTAPADKAFVVHRVHIYLADIAIDPIKYGGVAGPLANGVLVESLDAEGQVIKDYLDGEPIKSNADFSALAAADITHIDTAPSDMLAVEWGLSKVGGPLILQPNEAIRITIQDNLTTMQLHRACAQGYILPAQ